MAQATPDVEQLVSDYEDLWNGDFSKLDLVTESVTIYDPGVPSGVIQGREEFETQLREFHAAFPDCKLEIVDMLASVEIAMLHWTFTGTHEDEYNDIPPTGREIEMAGMSKLRHEEGEVQEDRIYYDRHEMFEQLGLVEE